MNLATDAVSYRKKIISDEDKRERNRFNAGRTRQKQKKLQEIKQAYAARLEAKKILLLKEMEHYQAIRNKLKHLIIEQQQVQHLSWTLDAELL